MGFLKKLNEVKFFVLVMVMAFYGVSAIGQNGRWERELSNAPWKLWLDHGALWYNDEVYLPPVDISKLPVNPPTGGWDKLHGNPAAIETNVPGTVEEHYWGEIGGVVPDTGGDFIGVSWWSRTFDLDASLKGKRILLAFQSVNLRAEVFVNGKLVGYDVIGNTPFDVDATEAVVFGGKNYLDIRITDPVGSFSWNDNTLMRWGDNLVPAVHGFGGITGDVMLKALDKNITISDIYVQNQPNPKKVKVITTVENWSGTPQKGQLKVSLHEMGNPNAEVWGKTINTELNSESNTFEVSATVSQAKLWELTINKPETERHAQLYEATVSFIDGNKIVDNQSQRFGFRWFDVKEKNGDKRFYLNGKRVFMLAAMTRGFWPKNGIFPTPEMAERDKDALYDFGLNTMLMHRAIGQPLVFDYADEAGLFTYEEPGGYRVTANRWDSIAGPDEQAYKWRSEKLRRMVIRDRSFPSMVIYNLKNEETNPPNEEDVKDMEMVHELDPSRVLTYNSGSDIGKSGDEYYRNKPNDPFELHALPFKPGLIYGGWWDQHHWYSYSGYTDDMYRNPKFYLRGVINAARVPLAKDSLYQLNKKKVIFFGEEGAFGTMVRLQKIKEEIEETSSTGFREREHLDWYEHYDRFLDETGFRTAYPNVDSLTMSLGRNLHYFHGRNIENVRMGNIADAYNMNGWASASTRTDVVDMYRNPTADPSIIRHYTQPLYVAVKLRNKVIPTGKAPIADIYLINEKNLRGRHNLELTLTDIQGNTLFEKNYSVSVKGGEEFGQMLVESVQLPPIDKPGHYVLNASLNSNGQAKATGFDKIFSVELDSGTSLKGSIAVLENDGTVSDFLSQYMNKETTSFVKGAPQTDVLIIGNQPEEGIAPELLQDILDRVENGMSLIVLTQADKVAEQIDARLKRVPKFYDGEGIKRWGGSGRLFTGLSPVLTGLPQGESMSWEYQCFYKGAHMGDYAQVQGIMLDYLGLDLIVALGNQGSKQILTALGRIPLGKGNVTISTLHLIPHLSSKEPNAVVAKKVLVNLLKY
ncbi:glycoside hydrolase family 2 protein [Muricauda sp. MAR_2010_75]|uniref:glycoside hydrolase family 2 protein n=1 Tax=Allomuricauda sp. MAR_2010_75 TaxID=1250232 RepID=UPI000563135A|nr:glycoside hydrolase family 2 [Muricauda sp. MAR_2010_75]